MADTHRGGLCSRVEWDCVLGCGGISQIGGSYGQETGFAGKRQVAATRFPEPGLPVRNDFLLARYTSRWPELKRAVTFFRGTRLQTAVCVT